MKPQSLDKLRQALTISDAVRAVGPEYVDELAAECQTDDYAEMPAWEIAGMQKIHFADGDSYIDVYMDRLDSTWLLIAARIFYHRPDRMFGKKAERLVRFWATWHIGGYKFVVVAQKPNGR